MAQKRMIVYGRLEQPPIRALFDGAKAAGLCPILRNPQAFTPDQTEPCEMVTVGGWHNATRAILNAYKRVPALVVGDVPDKAERRTGGSERYRLADITSGFAFGQLLKGSV
ncbi:hypothetical protein LCGC14_3163900 [marine sediment metagenome]|uniref:Uncharacterized protein n=1 Tax=marine sediment metagenome TaxID=412755 RepID=A0A0F8XWY0_9ZZZZ